MKENVINVSEKLDEKQENMRINNVNWKKNEFINMWFVKKYWTFGSSKKIYFFCIYKMYLVSAEGCKNADVHILII